MARISFFGFRIGFKYSLYLLQKAEKGENVNDKMVQKYADWIAEQVTMGDKRQRIEQLQELLAARPYLSLF